MKIARKPPKFTPKKPSKASIFIGRHSYSYNADEGGVSITVRNYKEPDGIYFDYVIDLLPKDIEKLIEALAAAAIESPEILEKQLRDSFKPIFQIAYVAAGLASKK